MLEFLDRDNHENGSEQRYEERKVVHMDAYGSKKRYYFWWLIHNSVVHPLMGFFPTHRMFALHDWSSGKINVKD
jgi:hypothetical protein